MMRNFLLKIPLAGLLILAAGRDSADWKREIAARDLAKSARGACVQWQGRDSRHVVADDDPAAGDMGWSEGSFVVTMTDAATGKPVASTGSHVTVYRREAGAWKAVSDIASAGPDSSPKEKNR